MPNYQILRYMDKTQQRLGLRLFSVDQALSANTIESTALISPVDAQPRLQSLLAHLAVVVPQGYIHIFSVISPTESLDLKGVLSSDEWPNLGMLNYPVSCYVEQPSEGDIQSLVDVVAQLRDPEGGCPWDLAQTPQTLTPYILEEAYEVIDAIQSGDEGAIADELGDLLLQVVLQAQIAHEKQAFSLAQVSQGITEKLIRRHPHVFGDADVDSVEDVRKNWEAIKASEQAIDPQDRDQLSRRMRQKANTFPPIMSGLKLAKLAAKAGLEWPNLSEVWAKFYEELAEFQEALLTHSEQDQLAELGDVLFTLINIARWCKLDPSIALRLTNQKLIERVQWIESQADKPLTDYSLEELDALWNHAKATLREIEHSA